MSDNEIIKALERMTEEDPEGFSSEILDLINRLNAEIMQREMATTNSFVAYKSLSSDFNSLKSEYEIYKALVPIRLKWERQDAIKEFAERLKNEFGGDPAAHLYVLFNDVVDNLVKEMTGGE